MDARAAQICSLLESVDLGAGETENAGPLSLTGMKGYAESALQTDNIHRSMLVCTLLHLIPKLKKKEIGKICDDNLLHSCYSIFLLRILRFSLCRL